MIKKHQKWYLSDQRDSWFEESGFETKNKGLN